MAMENEPFEDVSHIENGDFPASYVSLPEGTLKLFSWWFQPHWKNSVKLDHLPS